MVGFREAFHPSIRPVIHPVHSSIHPSQAVTHRSISVGVIPGFEIPVEGRTNPTKTLQDSVSLSVNIKDVLKLSDMIFFMCFLLSAIASISDFSYKF
jgi:hypothetical protein